MSPWDIAALVPCVEETGRVATPLTGETEDVVFAGELYFWVCALVCNLSIRRNRPRRR